MCIFLALRGKRDATAAQCETGREIASGGGERRRGNFVPFFFHLFLWPLEEESFPPPLFSQPFPALSAGEVNLVRRRDFDFPSPSTPEREGGREREKGQTDRGGRRRGREIRGTSATFPFRSIRRKSGWVDKTKRTVGVGALARVQGRDEELMEFQEKKSPLPPVSPLHGLFALDQLLPL